MQVSDRDLSGRRFNGYDLQLELNNQGHHACQFVMKKDSSESTAIPLMSNRSLFFRELLIEFEQRLSMNSLAFSAGRTLMEHKKFHESDIVHYHLIHNYILSLLDFPDLTAIKPSVWTIHDPWAFTGHCIHPQDCTGWKTGCRPCPKIHDYFPMQYDKAWQMWNIKKHVYSNLNIDIVVASEFMEDFVRTSPLAAHFERVHRIPFGIQVGNFGKIPKEEARVRLGIEQNDFVIAFRAEVSEFKGLKYILEMLNKLRFWKNITLLTVGFASLPKYLKKRYNVIELGWENDTSVIHYFYSACDVFLMPSMAESFGLMAIEVMASSRPVIVFEGTALPRITFAPECGIAVPRADSTALCEAVERLMLNPEECRKRGEMGRELAEKYYRFEDYVDRHIKLYLEILERNRI